ncbi:unnamed protein product [Orchesella dallaii]|uniref:Uncharacterized protein n=1 Tax=Orchesella dallaii TaxID=48710 RepID=A0ABP1QUD5_9HEXA
MFASTHLPVPEPFGDTIVHYNSQQQGFISEMSTCDWNDANVGASNGPSAIFIPSSLLNYTASASRQSLRLHETNFCEEDEDLEGDNGELEGHPSGSTLGINSRAPSSSVHHRHQGGTSQLLQSSGWI